MDTKQSRSIPKIQFRVLIIGRANAGKTTILQRVCDTTDSPTIYRRNSGGKREEVRHGCCLAVQILSSYLVQVKLDPSMEVSDKRTCPLSPHNSELAWRTRNRGRTGVLQPYGLYFSRFMWYRERCYGRTRHFTRVHSTQGYRKPTGREITCHLVRAVVC